MNYKRIFTSYSVKDIKTSKYFYTDILDLEAEETLMGVLHINIPKGEPVVLYPKENHEPSDYTVLNLSVNHLEEAVDELISKGIAFEQYEGEFIKTNAKGISDQGSGPKMAWLKDPSGNVIALIEE